MSSIKFTKTILMLLSFISSLYMVMSLPHHSNDDIVMVEEVIRYTEAGPITNGTLITLTEETISNHDDDDGGNVNESTFDKSDDLIFLTKRPQNQMQTQLEFQQSPGYHHNIPQHQHQQYQNQHPQHSDSPNQQQQQQQGHQYRKIVHFGEIKRRDDLLESEEEASATSSDEQFDTEIQLFNSQSPKLGKPIDFSDFLALVPAAEVKTIVANYYQNDPEVQHVYSYLNSNDFMALKQHVVSLPEIQMLLKFFNMNGLDILGFIDTLINMTRKPFEENLQQEITSQTSIEFTTMFDVTPTPSFPNIEAETTEEQRPHGLKGLVDSILMVLPQDEVLEKFFDKLENDEQFTKLVENIRTPIFAKILNKLQKSQGLKSLMDTLNKNGITILYIVDSLKAYFFLGGF